MSAERMSTLTQSDRAPVPGPRGFAGTPTAPQPIVAIEPERAEAPEPRLRQLIGVCGWAAVLGGIGLMIGVRGYFGVLTGAAPSWYEPAFAIFGLAGVALTIGAFLTVHRARPPWIMLGLSSASLVIVMVLTAIAY